MKKLALLAVLFSLIFPWSVIAQGEYQAVLYKPDVSQFPKVSSYLNVHQPGGGFIHGLDHESVLIMEDGKILPVDSIQEIRIGLQISVVINAGPEFARRNNKGVNRYEYMREYLEAWAQDQKEIGIDDLSLYTNSGLKQTHLTSSQAWLAGLATYQPDLNNSIPSMNTLGTAIQDIMDTQHAKPIHRAILYISPLPGEEMTDAIYNDLLARAQNADVKLFIWMLASKNDYDSPKSGYLRSLSEETGGQFFVFSGSEQFPEAQVLLEPLRYLYEVAYTSKIQTGGQHNLAVRVNLQDETITSAPATYQIDLKPPVPIFVGLPASIQREAIQKSEDPLANLSPASLQVDFIVQYPDKIQRDLVESRLLVDGEIAARNSTPPFNRFQWDLRTYTTSGRHSIQVEVLDTLGLSAASSELTVEIDVILPQKTAWEKFFENQGVFLILFGVFILGVAVSFIYIRLRSAKQTQDLRQVTPQRTLHRFERHTAGSNKQETVSEANVWEALCVRLDEDYNPVGDPAIHLDDQAITWGNDREKANIWLEDESLDAVHCKVWFADDQNYYVADNQSGSGTWLNGELVPAEGKILQNGDVFQVGKNLYRYEEKPPRFTREVVIVSYNIH